MGHMASHNRKRSTAADAVTRAMIPNNGRAGLYPFLPGPPPAPRQHTPHGPLADLGQRVHFAIVQQWVQTLTGPFDRANSPLGDCVFGDTFLVGLEHQADLESADLLRPGFQPVYPGAFYATDAYRV
jgi:hypothetical protein